MIYLDASVVVSLITPETHTAEVRRWLQGQPSGSALVSEWVLTEVASALSVQQRSGVLDDLGRARAERIQAWLLTALEVVPVLRDAFTSAARMSSRWRSGLRASDALHLAVAEEHRAGLCTRDVLQARAARQLGMHVVLLPEPEP